MRTNSALLDLKEAVAITAAFVSTKRDDVLQKGKFGIGLKTLHRLGRRLEIHSRHYHFAVAGSDLELVEPLPAIQSFFDADKDTLFSLELDQAVDEDELESWLSHLGAQSLLFLDYVRELLMSRLAEPRSALRHGIRVLPAIRLDCRAEVGSVVAETIVERYVRRPRRWTRYATSVPVPAHLTRAHKQTPPITTLYLAVSETGDAGAVYAGLPTGHDLGVPFGFSAQFDPETSRNGILPNDWNSWLLERMAELAAAAVSARLSSDPVSAWRAVGLTSQMSVTNDPNGWLGQRIASIVESQQTLLAGTGLPAGDACVKDAVYEEPMLAGLLTEDDQSRLRPSQPVLPLKIRDEAGIWRSVMEEIGEAVPIAMDEAIRMFQWRDELLMRTPDWFVRFAAAASMVTLPMSSLPRRQFCSLTVAVCDHTTTQAARS